jgi:UDPglucose--hexose-1-phosphate uridylyltransferase
MVSQHRTKRPWQGKVETLNTEKQPEYDPNCYLCPGNKRAGGAENPDYEKTYIFTNALFPTFITICNSKEIYGWI